MKEILRKIFGDKIANDKDIVNFYEKVNKIAMEEFAKEYHQKQLSSYDIVIPSTNKCNRFEVIDESGRSYVNKKPVNNIKISLQDNNETIKIFINNKL